MNESLPSPELARVPGVSRRDVDLSIIVPVYFNEGCLEPTMKQILDGVVAARPDRSVEVIFVDDGSRDGSLRELLEIRSAHPELVRIIKLTRNFGQVNAILAGMVSCAGRYVCVMSADGQDPPALITEMLDAHERDAVDVVIATRRSRDESAYRRWTSRLFYSLMRRLSFPEMPKGGFDFLSMSRRVMNVILACRETNPFLQGLLLYAGFEVRFIEYDRAQRIAGESRWTMRKKINYLVDGVVGFSFVPIRFMSLLGMLTAFAGVVYALVIAVAWLAGEVPFKGWAPIMVVVLFLGGLQLLTLGMLGEYVWRTLAQVRTRPPFVIDRTWP